MSIFKIINYCENVFILLLYDDDNEFYFYTFNIYMSRVMEVARVVCTYNMSHGNF